MLNKVSESLKDILEKNKLALITLIIFLTFSLGMLGLFVLTQIMSLRFGF